MAQRFEQQQSLSGIERVRFLNSAANLLDKPWLGLGKIYDVLSGACLLGNEEYFKPGSTVYFTQEYFLGSEVLGLCLLPPSLKDHHTELIVDRNEIEYLMLKRYRHGQT